jgi:Holliday junction resolvase RusA-like endonuclease
MTFTVIFTVDGNPVAKGRPRFAKRGKFVQTYTPQKTKDYESLVMDSASEAMGASEPLETPVKIFIHIRMPIPASYSKRMRQDCLDQLIRPVKKPDWDNVAKAITDALNGIVYVDDCQIVDAHVTKRYSDVAGVDVIVMEELP